ncbi:MULTISPECIES: flagellar assembly protein FliH [Vibrio]|jgi:flagellar assembly protein FliH|uniref:Flagellar assembly protein FliH n=2 Tax=Vibrio TaxID=662 RepID=A0A2C9PA28_9VIBR|nr:MULTISPECIES: flagellar assembly protein FliH [Vibrio]ASI89548.1 flagellar assembly protein FliH [Vibrio mediterranei]AYV21512.1 flagellar assembly protein H [Vibrio mediterranei]EDL53311.1 flagellar assembly protein H [Vibrio mediterranei AK1]KFA96802.1 flagellar assembly protein FliH [Vibrio sp. ER1A]MCF4175532.1 flagellar assembly protein H [Vibrio sp. McD22-P3]
MKEKAIFTLPPSGYRQHRFPPLAQPSAVDEFTAELSWDDAPTQIDVQERLEEGFQQGLERGHREGLNQGIEQGKQQGLLEGQKEGFQKGFVSGEQSGKQAFLDAVKPVNDIYVSLSRWQEEKEQQQRHIICELVQKVAQQVIRAELTLMPQQILALVDETLEAMPGKTEKVTVHLNPQDLERITQINPELADGWKLVAKPELPVGGCHLVTEDAEADASCDSRLESCMDAVKEHLLDEVTPIDLASNDD